MKRWALGFALVLGLSAPLWAQTLPPAHDQDGLPLGGTANEVGPAIYTEEFPSLRVSLWCATAGTACQGIVTIEAQQCPTCPWKIMNGPSGTANPAPLDAQGRGDWVWIAPRMYAYRCNLQGYQTGGFACHIGGMSR